MASITVFLCGGLGNQLFQYAAGRMLSLKNKVPLLFDLAGFEFDTYYKRPMGLSHFNIAVNIGTASTIWQYKACNRIRSLSQRIPLVSRIARPLLLVELSQDFDQCIIDRVISRDALMLGYWQDERYFSDIRATIKKEFTLAKPLSPANAEIERQIAGCPATVAVHVRRLHEVAAGTVDTAKASAERSHLGISLRTDYYDSCARLIEHQVSAPNYFVFSDDPQWAENNLKLNGNVTFLSKGRGPDHEDMILMSRCQHHIVANSSFSWWGAWLADSTRQIVVAPKGVRYTPNIPDHWLQC